MSLNLLNLFASNQCQAYTVSSYFALKFYCLAQTCSTRIPYLLSFFSNKKNKQLLIFKFQMCIAILITIVVMSSSSLFTCLTKIFFSSLVSKVKMFSQIGKEIFLCQNECFTSIGDRNFVGQLNLA